MTNHSPQSDHHDTAARQLGATESLRDAVNRLHRERPDGSDDASLHRVDAMLDRLAQHERVPSQVAWRIFAASATELPGRAKHSGAWRHVARSRMHTSFWGQVAMAASVALTFIAASWLMLPEQRPAEQDGYALNDAPAPSADRAQPTVEPASYDSADRMAWVVRHSELDYLYEASGTSLADLTSDVASIREDLGL